MESLFDLIHTIIAIDQWGDSVEEDTCSRVCL